MIKTLTSNDIADYDIPFISSSGEVLVLRNPTEYNWDIWYSCNSCCLYSVEDKCQSSPECRDGYFEKVDKLTQVCIMNNINSSETTK